jgi:endonuclease G
VPPPAAPTGAVALTVPLHITLSFGPPGAGPALSVAANGAAANGAVAGGEEAVVIDPDFDAREGYDPDFLGFPAPFPRLTAATRPQAFARPGVAGDARFLLHYHHYSVLFNRERKLAFAAGVNLDPAARFTHRRERDRWFLDPRVPADLQCGEALYARNPLDRGHLVRRADAGWGHSAAEAKRANDDTFHFTNCSPQHEVTNQGRDGQAPPGLLLWGKLEDHVAAQGRGGRRKLSIFNGPVFRPDDALYRGICRLPREFWKVVAFADDAGDPGAAAFVLTQADLIAGLEEEFRLGEFKAVQVAVSDLEGRTGLNFGPLAEWDVFGTPRAAESTGGQAARVLGSPADMVL